MPRGGGRRHGPGRAHSPRRRGPGSALAVPRQCPSSYKRPASASSGPPSPSPPRAQLAQRKPAGPTLVRVQSLKPSRLAAPSCVRHTVSSRRRGRRQHARGGGRGQGECGDTDIDLASGRNTWPRLHSVPRNFANPQVLVWLLACLVDESLHTRIQYLEIPQGHDRSTIMCVPQSL